MAFTVLAACRATSVEVAITQADIEAADSANNIVWLPFTANFEHNMGGDETQKQLKRMEVVAREYLTLDTYVVADRGLVSISGKLPLSRSPVPGHAYQLTIQPFDALDGMEFVRLDTNAEFEGFARDTNRIFGEHKNTVVRYQPNVTFNLSANGMRVVVAGAYLNDKAAMLVDTVINGAATIRFDGGAFKDTYVGFFIDARAR
ncbi:MAG: hypothetical protein AAGP08_09825 [Pseudomonadota bacterium]